MIKIENVPIVRFDMLYDSGSMIEFEMIDKTIKIGHKESIIKLGYHNTWGAFFPTQGIVSNSFIELKRKKYNKFIWDVMIDQGNIENYFKKDKEFLEDNKIIEEYIYLTFKAVNPYEIRNQQYVIWPTLWPFKCCFENNKKPKKEEKSSLYTDYATAVHNWGQHFQQVQREAYAPALQDNAANGNGFYEVVTQADGNQEAVFHATPSPNHWQTVTFSNW